MSKLQLHVLTVAAVGGIVGILLGAGAARLLSAFTPLPAAMEWWSVAAGILVSSTVGLVSGVWPAVKAARLDPIEALRYE